MNDSTTAPPYDWRKTLTKILARGATSAGLVAVAAAAEYVDNGLPGKYLALVPILHGLLAGASNWLKHKESNE